MKIQTLLDLLRDARSYGVNPGRLIASKTKIFTDIDNIPSWMIARLKHSMSNDDVVEVLLGAKSLTIRLLADETMDEVRAELEEVGNDY